MEEIFSYAANFCFPMVMSVYLLVRFEGRIGALDASIQELSRAIARLA